MRYDHSGNSFQERVVPRERAFASAFLPVPVTTVNGHIPKVRCVPE